MIANDIIDRNLARKHTRALEERYWRKVLLEEEIATISKQTDPLLAFHAAWAAKEATYKLVCKLNEATLFSPKSILIKDLSKINSNGSTYFSTQTPQGLYRVQLNISSDKIEAFAALNLHQLKKASFQAILLPNCSYKTQSFFTKHHLLSTLSKSLDLPLEKISIKKENSIPRLYISHKKAPIDITLSHHGYWGAFGYAC